LLFLLGGGWLLACSAGESARRERPFSAGEEDIRGSWFAAMGDEFNGLLQTTGRGLSLTDISGDCWGQVNSQRAVFLRRPRYRGNYYLQVRVSGFIPGEPYAQVGVVAWGDQDHYVRNMVGFQPGGFECLAELSGAPSTRGILRFFPLAHPVQCFLRLEVLGRSIRGYHSYDGRIWFNTGAFTLPEEKTTDEYLEGIGIIGVGGGMAQPPVFSEWAEAPLPAYSDDDFAGLSPGPQWMLGQTNGGWGSGETTWWQHEGKLWIRPHSGADVFINHELYPFAACPAPRDASWEVEIKLCGMDPRTRGLFNKSGVVLWQDSGRYVCLAAVKDRDYDQMYCEAVAWCPQAGSSPLICLEGFRPRRPTDVYFRLRRASVRRYTASASYDREEWFTMGSFLMFMPEPEIRLFASGDVNLQHRAGFDHVAAFDYIRRVGPTRDGDHSEK